MEQRREGNIMNGCGNERREKKRGKRGNKIRLRRPAAGLVIFSQSDITSRRGQRTPEEDLGLSSMRYPPPGRRRKEGWEGGDREEREERNVAKEIKKMKKRNTKS